MQPERYTEPNPDAEDEAYDAHVQRQIDEATHNETILRQQIEERQQ